MLETSEAYVLHGDCLLQMRKLAAGSIDAIITDPPYCSGSVSEAQRTAARGQGLRSENVRRLGWFVGDNMGTAGLVWLLRAVAFESIRLLKQSGSLLVFCDWRMVPNLAPAIESAGFRYQNMIVWDKGSMGLGNGFRAQHEIVLHFTAGNPDYYHRGTGNVIKTRAVSGYLSQFLRHHRRPGNVIKCRRVTAAERKHQTEKPLDLLAQLIEVVTPPGGTVLDVFGGSGSLVPAAKSVGRSVICIERDLEHVGTTQQRGAQLVSLV